MSRIMYVYVSFHVYVRLWAYTYALAHSSRVSSEKRPTCMKKDMYVYVSFHVYVRLWAHADDA